jgi:hypothetical protein
MKPSLVSAVTLAGALCIPLSAAPSAAQDSIQYRLLKGPDYQVFEDGVTPRARVRANYYKEVPGDQWGVSPGQVSIEYGLPVWKPEYVPMFEKMPLKKRWRLGSNYWTNLSSSLPFEVGGQKLRAGYYYLVLERTEEKRWSLIILEPAEITRRGLDPYHVNLKDSGPGVAVPLEWERSESPADRLEIKLKLKDADPKEMTIQIRFGPHQFRSAPLRVQF